LVAACRGLALFGKDVPVGAEIHRIARRKTAVLVLETGRRGAPPESLLGQRLEDNRVLRAAVFSRRCDASGQCHEHGDESETGRLHGKPHLIIVAWCWQYAS
ncbi:MAG: hypothetical protein ACK56I_26725, partial [bacterium]